MENMTVDTLEKLKSLIEQEANNRRECAAYSGSRDDGGASSLLHSLDMYMKGYARLIPDEWNKFLKEVERDSDPEYEEYKRLKKKFDDE